MEDQGAIDRRTALLAGLAVAGLSATGARAAPAPATETIALWPKGAPGMPARPPVLKVDSYSKDPAVQDRVLSGIARPSIEVFRAARPNGGAMLIMPGGGYTDVVVDKEGNEVARWLAGQGITCFVLTYRLPAEGWANPADTPLSDAQRAIRLIRAHAGKYGIDAKRVGAMGFSAGGHLCADLATRFAARVYEPVDAADGLSARPDAAAPIYPVISMEPGVTHAGSRANLIGADADAARTAAHSADRNVTAQTPPCFLLHAEDDDVVPVENILRFRAALRAKGVTTETHLFPDSGHGFGIRQIGAKSVAPWPGLFLAWAARVGIAG
ncbi:alpha/beta hydrolase [Sphingomonas sp. MMS12-HWE2-04]|uniref:alpha/beta hydrolase n=1 Tax=Sphingomonas sp. MMS12-HWE2-04 TaxID=3234199 RepID=UPI00384BBD3A